jgi:hypothetical protein
MDDISPLIEKKKALLKEQHSVDEHMRRIKHELTRIETELTHVCATSCDGHQFEQIQESGMYGDTLYICTVCDHEQL